MSPWSGGSGPHLSSFAHVLGDEVPLAEVQDDVLRREVVALRAQGLRSCRVADASVVGLAAASCRKTLASLHREEIGAIVYCTDTSPETTPTNEVWQLVLELDLPRTPITFVSGSGCGNLGPALSAARALILVEGVSVVLVVTADRVRAGTRYLANGQTAMSDGAASFIVSSRPLGAGVELRGLANSFRADIGTVDARPIIVAKATAQAVKSTVRRAIEPLSLATKDFRYLLTGNYGRTAREFLATSAGIPGERVHCPALDRTGHCFSADVLLGLESLLSSGQLDDSDHLVLLTMSPRSWSVAAITARLPDSSGG